MTKTEEKPPSPAPEKAIKYKITFSDTISARDFEDAVDKLLAYLEECVTYQDATAFDIKEIRGRQKRTPLKL